MLKIVSSVLLGLTLVLSAQGQQPQSAPAKTVPAKTDAPAQQAPAGFIVPAEANVRIEPDVRTFVVMAAINVAGFDYETAGQPLSPARAEIRKDLANLDPAVKEKLTAYYKSHRRAGVDEATDAARYAALSLMMTQPPAFAIYHEQEQSLPEDLRPLTDFSPLVSEFYIKSGIRELLPKYMAVGNAYAAAYRQPVGELIYQTLEYFHASPETIINMRPLVVTSNEPQRKKEQPKVVARNRTRQVFVVPDPLGALGNSFVRGDILNQKDELLTRRVGDDYIVIIGPSKSVNADAVRQALIRFVIDPLVERHLRAALEFKEPIVALASSVPTAGKAYTASVYLVIRESLAQAAEARMRRIQAQGRGGSYGEDDAVYDLAQAYLRGAVLSFHFYDALKGFEQVGIGLEAFFDQMVATAKFDREAARAREFEPVVARVSEARRAKSPRSAAEGGARTMEAVGAISKKVLLSDDLIRQRRYDEARQILESILAAEPNNARALYGMAQVVSQKVSPAEEDPKADENDKIQAQYDRLQQAVKLYRKAIDNASPESEKWIIQWSHVLLGRIYDFQGFRADAVAEYEKAIAMKEVQYGALKEAMEGKQRPYGQKN